MSVRVDWEWQRLSAMQRELFTEQLIEALGSSFMAHLDKPPAERPEEWVAYDASEKDWHEGS